MTKYHAKPTIIDNIRFASLAEARRYQELQYLLSGGEIADLVLQPKFHMMVNGKKICTYAADFQYTIPATGEVIVEDVKGMETPVFRLKRKLLNTLYGFDVEIVK